MRKTLLKASAMLASLTFVVSGSMLDNPTWTPTIICAVSLIYLALFVYANRKDME